MTLFSSGCIFIIIAVLNLTNASLPLTRVAGRYYYFTRSEQNQQGASSFCTTNGLRLASFETESELNSVSYWIINQMNYPRDWQFWTSGNDFTGSYRWAATNKALTYNGWAPGEPDNEKSVEHCISAWHHSSGQLRLNDNNCARNLPFLCEKV